MIDDVRGSVRACRRAAVAAAVPTGTAVRTVTARVVAARAAVVAETARAVAPAGWWRGLLHHRHATRLAGAGQLGKGRIPGAHPGLAGLHAGPPEHGDRRLALLRQHQRD